MIILYMFNALRITRQFLQVKTYRKIIIDITKLNRNSLRSYIYSSISNFLQSLLNIFRVYANVFKQKSTDHQLVVPIIEWTYLQ